MNLFGVGGWELFLVFVIMLIVAGPKRIVQWAYTLGKWSAKMQQVWQQTVKVLQSELDEAGIEVQLPQELPTRHSLRQTAQQFGKQVMSPALDPFAEASKELQDGLKASITEVKQVANEVDTSLKTTEAHPNHQP
jgi:Sec-independent protein translocase protein TatA